MSEFIFSPAVQGNLPKDTSNYFVAKYNGTFSDLTSSSYLTNNFKNGDILQISTNDIKGLYSFDGTTLNKYYSGSVASYAIYKLSANVTTNTAHGDHCQFDTTSTNIDPNNLQTLGTSTYTTHAAVNCIGRVKLSSGYYYKITGFVSSSGQVATYFTFSIFDVTSSATQIGTWSSGFTGVDANSQGNSAPTFAIVQADNDTIIELRVMGIQTGTTIGNWSSGSSDLSECSLTVEALGQI